MLSQHQRIVRVVDKRAAIVATYADGCSLTETAALNGVSQSTARRYVLDAGIMRDQGGSVEKLRKPTDTANHIEEIAARRRSGETYEMIARRFDVSRERIRQLLHQYGHSDLVGYLTWEKPCAVCGEVMRGTKSRINKIKVCRGCRGELRRRKVLEARWPHIKSILLKRAQGWTWGQINDALGLTNSCAAVTVWSERARLEIGWAFPGMKGTKLRVPLNWEAQIIKAASERGIELRST